jgi:CHAT domain-containing protein/Flp pilus assembly protein TadD
VAYDRARLLFVHGDLETSQKNAELGYARVSHTDPELALKFAMLDAEAMIWRGMFTDALQVLSVQNLALNDPQAHISKLALEGVAYAHLGQFPAADQRLTEAEKICEPAAISTCGEVLRARGLFAVQRGQFAEAKRFYLESLSFAQAHHDRAMESTAYLNLGFVAFLIEHYDEAVDWLRSAYQAGVELGDENQIQGSLGNLGAAYIELGDAERASQMFLEAEKRATKLGNVRDQLKWQMNAGYVYMIAGNFQQAKRLYLQALKLAQGINSKEDVVNAALCLGSAAIADRNPYDGQRYADQALSMAQQSGSKPNMLGAMAIQMQAAALRGDTTIAEQLLRRLELDPESDISVKWASEAAMAKLYDRQGKVSAAKSEYSSALATFETARSQLQHSDSQLPFAANATDIYDDYIHFLVTQGKAVDALITADQSRARTLAQGLDATGVASTTARSISSPQAIARKAGATLLFYWLGEKQSYLWAITPQKTTLFPLPAQGEITTLVERYRKLLLGPTDPLEAWNASNATGLALYKMLVAPAAGLVRANAPVMILADGPLSLLNFETLVVPGATPSLAPHYWIEDATLLSAPSLAMLEAAKPARGAGGKLLLLGDAISPNDEYPQLPYASAEMQRVASHFGPHDEAIFARKEATPGAYLASDPRQYSYIHFVSHGVASRTDPLDSAIILSRGSTAEDSFKLYAREIMQHPIDARLVTISACYGSGTRAYVGEGLVGLSWAFLRAGAHNAVGALWEASDQSTAQLMDTMYQGLEDGESPASALRRAKLALLHSEGRFRRPFYWAPFQLYTRL